MRNREVVALPVPVAENWEWQRGAACAQEGVDPELFFNPWDDPPLVRQRREREAVQVCRRCPIREACLQWSLDVREPYGVWGGVTEDERRRMLRRMRRTSAP